MPTATAPRKPTARTTGKAASPAPSEPSPSVGQPTVTATPTIASKAARPVPPTPPVEPVPVPRKPRKPAHGVCSASVVINGVRYALKPVPCDREAARQCFELRKGHGTNEAVYHVSRHDYGAECTCPDFVYSRDGIDPTGCKHIKALLALQILDSRAPRVRPVPPSAWDDDPEAEAEHWPTWADAARYGINR